MRRSHFPAPFLSRVPAAALVAALTVTALAGCGEDPIDEVGSDAPASEATPEETTSEPTATESTPAESTEPTATSTNVRTSDNITLRKPAEGATVSGSFTAAGKANSPEANVPWQVRDADGTVVVEGFATAEGWMDKLYPWRTKVDVSELAPGSYTFVAMTEDPSGGAEGKGAEEVSASITVE